MFLILLPKKKKIKKKSKNFCNGTTIYNSVVFFVDCFSSKLINLFYVRFILKCDVYKEKKIGPAVGKKALRTSMLEHNHHIHRTGEDFFLKIL
jgi:hypothetical protein